MSQDTVTERRDRALDRLSIADQRRVQRIRRQLRLIWSKDDVFMEIVRALHQLEDDAAVIAYHMDSSGRITQAAGCLDGPFHQGLPPKVEHIDMTQHVEYRLDRTDPFSNQPVATGTLYQGKPPERLDQYRQEVMVPLDHWYQLRTVFHDQQGRFIGHCGFMRSQRRGEYEQREAELFTALVPELLDGLETLRILGGSPLSEAELARCLDAFDQPALLVSHSGAIEHANAVARSLDKTRPRWLEALDDAQRDTEADALLRVTPLLVDGRELMMVVPRQRQTNPQAELESLPGKLEAVVQLVAQGLSDKEIAERLCLSHNTIRAYVSRSLKRLDLPNRAAIIARFGASITT